MLGGFWDWLLKFFEKQPFWRVLEPVFLLCASLVVAHVLAYGYIQAQYGYAPPLGLFLTSYLSIRIFIAFGAVVLALVLLRLWGGLHGETEPSRLVGFFRAHRRGICRGVFVTTVAAVAVTLGFQYTAPERVSHIRIKFLDRPVDFDRHAFAYLVYELNNLQKNWYFDVDYRIFNPEILTVEEEEKCERLEVKVLGYAETHAKGKPLIGITSKPLGPASFCTHRANVSVISTADRKAYEPLSTYEYLMYCIILQSTLIHLDVHGGGVPEGAFDESSVSHGGLFQFNPEKGAIKATVLTARLGRAEEGLLFHRFGAEYVSTFSTLLTLDWLRSPRVAGNLQRCFGVVIPGVARGNSD